MMIIIGILLIILGLVGLYINLNDITKGLEDLVSIMSIVAGCILIFIRIFC